MFRLMLHNHIHYPIYHKSLHILSVNNVREKIVDIRKWVMLLYQHLVSELFKGLLIRFLVFGVSELEVVQSA